MRLSRLAANTEANSSRALLDGGWLRVYAGPMPAPDADAPVPAEAVLLVEHRFGTPAFRRAQGGVADAFPLVQVAAALADGEATWYRASGATGLTVQDGRVGADADLVMDRVDVRTGAAVQVMRFTYRIPLE